MDLGTNLPNLLDEIKSNIGKSHKLWKLLKSESGLVNFRICLQRCVELVSCPSVSNWRSRDISQFRDILSFQLEPCAQSASAAHSKCCCSIDWTLLMFYNVEHVFRKVKDGFEKFCSWWSTPTSWGTFLWDPSSKEVNLCDSCCCKAHSNISPQNPSSPRTDRTSITK